VQGLFWNLNTTLQSLMQRHLSGVCGSTPTQCSLRRAWTTWTRSSSTTSRTRWACRQTTRCSSSSYARRPLRCHLHRRRCSLRSRPHVSRSPPPVCAPVLHARSPPSRSPYRQQAARRPSAPQLFRPRLTCSAPRTGSLPSARSMKAFGTAGLDTARRQGCPWCVRACTR
jgi:hypothetical protein